MKIHIGEKPINATHVTNPFEVTFALEKHINATHVTEAFLKFKLLFSYIKIHTGEKPLNQF